MSAAETVGKILRDKGFKDISYEKMTYSRSNGKYALYLNSDKKLSGKHEAKLRESVLKELKEFFPSVDVFIRQPAASIMDDDDAFASEIKNMLLEFAPALIPFVKGCVIKKSGLSVDITFDREVAPDLVRASGAADAIEGIFESEYGEKIRIRELSFDESSFARDKEYKPSEEVLIKRQAAEAVPGPAQKPASKPRAAKKDEKTSGAPQLSEGVIFGKKISAIPVAMNTVEQNTVTVIEGDVIAAEVRTVKDNRFTIALFNVTDRTTTLRCKIFMRGDHADELESKLVGARLRVRGKLEEDSFSRGYNGKPELVFSVSDVNKAERIKKKDNAPQKRVELHLHTNMSSMDALTEPADYIKRAAEWGHKAIAITDHGVVQAFPFAQTAGSKYGVKVIYGMEAYMFDDEKPVYDGTTLPFDGRLTVFDIETTGLNSQNCGITEIGAVRIENGRITDRFSTFVNPGMKIPPNIVTLTGITDDMVADAPDEKEAVSQFLNFVGDDCLAAHNARFDMGFIAAKCKRDGLCFTNEHFDTLEVARIHLSQMTSHKLDKLCAHYGITLHHHRAVNDAEATAEVVLKMFSELKDNGLKTLNELNYTKKKEKNDKNAKTKHTIILAKNKKGLSNLYRLVSAGHIDYFYRKPRIPKSLVSRLREGLIIGSACCEGELFEEIIDGASDERIERTASFYDYLEIQPVDNNAFLIREGRFTDKEQLREVNKRIFDLAKKLGKPIVATCDCHFLEPEDEVFRRVVMDSMGFKDCDTQPPLYYRTTEEMLEEFSYLGEEGALEAVVTNPNKIADIIDEIDLFPKETAMPYIENADKDITEAAYSRMYQRYGNPLPENIKERLDKELGSIIKHGYAVLYWIAMNLVKKSNADGYLVGSRGSVGSSLAAYATGITEVNPLPPHYICLNCHHSDFNIDVEKYACGVDMPKAVCPICGSEYESDGYDIPFEVFLGFNADKVPDIDLNFSSEYQPNAHKYIEEVFGENYVYRAGTISAIKEKTAEGFVRKYMEKRGLDYPKAEISRIALGMTGVKRTTGQHPGGMVIVPKDRDVYEFTAIQKPANDMSVESTTTHFDFNSMHDKLIKLDILGHDNPTMIRELQNTIGFDPLTIPINDKETLSLFSSTKALKVEPEDIMGVKVGTLGIPEFGTKFVRGMLMDTKPETMSELIRISGLSHGTNVWNDNADQLIASGQAKLKDAICTRDDIMTTLIRYGADKKMSFDIMESVRKGKWAKHKEGRQEEMEKAIMDAGAPDWFVESCRKIGYMFPKAHAVAYVIMALRIAYCKVHHPVDYYTAYFTVRGTDFDAKYSANGMESILDAIREIKAKEARSATDDDALTNLEIAQEMYARGISFLPVDLKKSRAKKYVIEDGNIRMPFLSIPKLGEKAAINLEKVMKEKDVLSIDELKKEAKLSSAVIDAMRQLGCLNGLSESSQLSIFDIM